MESETGEGREDNWESEEGGKEGEGTGRAREERGEGNRERERGREGEREREREEGEGERERGRERELQTTRLDDSAVAPRPITDDDENDAAPFVL